MKHGGFTFVEVLIAMAVAAILITISCISLLHVLRTELRARELREAGFHLQTVACRAYLDRDSPEEIDKLLAPAWRAAVKQETTGEKDDKEAWMIWTIHPSKEETLRYTFALRSDLGPWQ